MKSADELDLLLSGLADGILSQEEEARLVELLRGATTARRRYREFMTLHSALMWDYASVAVPLAETSGMQAPPARSKWWWKFSAVAAIVLLLAALAAIWLPGRATIAELDSVAGAVSWSGEHGAQRSGLAPGAKLPGGTLLVESEAGSAQLRFHDGTVLTLAGESELVFSDAGQKRLTLRRGTLSAQVQRQPANRPLVIRTTTAELEVLGTEFSVAADPAKTALNVENGNVRMRRLADGQSVEVKAKQAAIASLDAKGDLNAARSKAPPAQWHRNFGAPPSPADRGEWKPAVDGAPARMRAIPIVAGRGKDGVPVIHYAVSSRANANEPIGFVTVSNDSVFHARLQTDRPVPLKLFLSCMQGGTFAGNFEVALPKTMTDASGVVTVDAPLAAARPIMPDRYPKIDGTQISLLMLHSIETDAGLEVSELAIEPGRSSP